MSTPKKASIGLLATIAAVIVVYHFVIARSNSDPATLAVSGNIEVIDAEVAFKIPGRVEKRLVDEGMMVKEGQVVAVLECKDLVAQVEARRADLAAAQAALAELEAGSRPQEIEAAWAALQKAEAALKEADVGFRPQEIAAAEAEAKAAAADAARLEAELARASELFRRQTISQEDYDAAKAAYTVAAQKARQAAEQLDLVKEGVRKEQKDQAKAARDQLKAQYELIKIGPRQEQIDQARARVQQAKAALRLAETQLDYATVRSPLTGVVLSKNVEPGEYVAPGTPVVTVGDLVNVWLRAYVDETDLGRVKVGQKAEVTTDTWPGTRYLGWVSFIASEAEFTPKSVQTQKQRVKLVYRIKINIHNPSMELKPGMPADARILLDAPQ